jgi:hypothetical protein
MQRKSIFLVIICLFLGAGLSQLSAQNNGAIQDWMRSWEVRVDVYCDGDIVDVIDCTVDIHQVRKMDLVPIWRIYQLKGEGVSRNTDEVFKYKEGSKSDYDNLEATWHYHLIGNMGTVYIGFVTYDWTTREVTLGPTVCK